MADKKFDLNQKIDWCFAILGTGGTWVYNYPMSSHYDVYNNELNCFEIESHGSSHFVLTVNDNVFDSNKYDNKIRSQLNRLWNTTLQKYEQSK